jgi:hypothetical protein
LDSFLKSTTKGDLKKCVTSQKKILSTYNNFAPLKFVEYDEGNWQCGKEAPQVRWFPFAFPKCHFKLMGIGDIVE